MIQVINICYWPAGRSVQGKTVTEVLKMLPEAAGRGQHFQARGHSFYPYGPTLSRTITFLSFFLSVKLAFKRVCLRNSVIELAFRAVYKPVAKKPQNNNERTREYLLDKERCIKEQIYFELLDVSCIYFTSEVLQKCLFRCEISCKVWSCTTKTISVSR